MNTTLITIDKFCKLFSIHKTYDDLRLALETMPCWPSFWSINKYLNSIGLDCETVVATQRDIFSLRNKAVLIHATINGHDETLLVKTKKNRLFYYSPFNNKWLELSDTVLSEIWDGVMILPNKESGIIYCWNTIMYLTIFIIGASLIFIERNIMFRCEVVIATLGLIASTAYWRNTIHEPTDRKMPLCIIGDTFDCNIVYNSRYSTIYGIPMIVLANSYFINVFIWLILIISTNFPVQSCISSLNAIATMALAPAAIHSLVAQFTLKKFCLYCISVLLLLACQSVAFLFDIEICSGFVIAYIFSLSVITLAA